MKIRFRFSGIGAMAGTDTSRRDESGTSGLKTRTLTGMNFRSILIAGMALTLAGCTTTAGLSGDPLSARWVGTEAGKFFAAYGPPVSDEVSGSTTTYVWRGGYKTRRTPAQYEGEGKSKKLIARAKTEYLACQVRLKVGEDYMIRTITKVVDKAGAKDGPTWCEQVLDAAKAEK